MTHPAAIEPPGEPGGDRAAALLALLASFGRELHSGLPAREVSLDSSLDRDLGLDSLSRVELLMRLEQRFDVRVREEELAVAETPRDLLRLLGSSSGRGVWRLEVEPPVAVGDAGPGSPDRAETLVEVLEWHVERHPDRRHVLLYGEGDSVETASYAELHQATAEIAAGLRAQGLVPGDPVAIMLPTSIEYFHVFYGALFAGLVPVPLYPPVRLSQLEDHLRRQARILDNCRAPALITVPEAKAAARLLRGQVDSLRLVLTVADLRESSAAAPRVVHRGRGSDLAFLQYTSGSTGQPKGVALSHDNLLANLRGMLGVAGLTSRDVFVSWLPLYHDMGLIGAGMGSLYGAFPLVLMSPLGFLSRPSRWLRAISDHRGTVSGGPNFAYELCLAKIPESEIEGIDLASWRLAFNGAEPVLPETLRRFGERFAGHGLRPEAMLPVYGLAESTLGVAFPPPLRGVITDRIDRRAFARESRAQAAAADDDTALTFVGCGFPLPGHQLRIADDAGRELAERAIGRVQLRGPSTTRGYYRSPESTRELFVDDWVESGDLGYLVGGELFLTGRSKDLIIKAGRNLSPYEIEEAAGDVTGVRKGCVAAFGVSGGDTGTDRLVVLAETRASDPEERERIRAAVFAAATSVAGAAPDDVVMAPPGTVLKTSSGKIRRSASRDLYLAGRVGRRRSSVSRQFVNLGLSSIVPSLRRLMRTAATVLYTFWVWLVLGVVVTPLAFAVLVLPGLQRRQALTRMAARAILRLAGVPLRCGGFDHLPRDERFVAVVNHASYADALVLAATLLPGASIVAKRELGPIAPARFFFERIGVTLVERFDREQGAQDARHTLDLLLRQQSLVAFPEGTFTRIPGLLPFRLGPFQNAAEAGAPVVPMAIRGTRSLLRAGEWLIRRGPLALSIQPPIRPKGSDWQSALDLRDRARAAILAHCGEPDLNEERDEGLPQLRAQRAASAP